MTLRCSKCNKLLARYTQCQGLEIKCTRCGTHNHVLRSDIPVQCAVLSNNPFPLPRSNPMPAVPSQD